MHCALISFALIFACCPVCYIHEQTCILLILLTLAVGVFEMEAFSKGTFAIASTLAELTDKVVVVVQLDNNDKFFTSDFFFDTNLTR